MEGHEDEIFSCAFNYEGDTIITGSKDNTCRIWKDSIAMKNLKKAPEWSNMRDVKIILKIKYETVSLYRLITITYKVFMYYRY